MKFDFIMELGYKGIRFRVADMEYSDDIDTAWSSVKNAMERYPRTDIFILTNVCTDAFAFDLINRILDDPFCDIFFNYEHQAVMLCKESVSELKFNPYHFLPLKNHAMVELVFRIFGYDKQMNELLRQKSQEEEGNE